MTRRLAARARWLGCGGALVLTGELVALVVAGRRILLGQGRRWPD